MNINNEDLKKIIEEIVSGSRIVVWKDTTHIIKYPTALCRNIGQKIYENEKQKAIWQGIITEEELFKQLKDTGEWTKDDDSKIEELISRIGTNKRLKMRAALPLNKKKIEEAIEKLTQEYYECIFKKYKYHAFCAEGVALSIKELYVLSKCICLENGHLKWSSFDKILDETDIKFIYFLRDKLREFYLGIDYHILRAASRNNLFRAMWNIAKKTGKLFNNNIEDWTKDQIELVSWSLVYDSVYDAYHRPPQQVIDDDDMLDEWLNNKYKEAEAAAYENHKGLNLSAGGETVLVGATREDLEILRGGENKPKHKNIKNIDVGLKQ